MSAAVAAPPVSTSPFATISSSAVANIPSAPPSAEPPAAKRTRSNGSPAEGGITTLAERSTVNGKTSPNTIRTTAAPPAIKVKKEPGSPAMQSSRPRPKRLDLSSTMSSNRGPQSSRPSAPLNSRDSGLAIQDVGLACLSPGFQTNDPSMREQLQRSLDVRDQQRQIIEARQKGQKPGSSHEGSDSAARPENSNFFGMTMRTPNTSRRKGPPPGLSINAPSAAQFANDRVIQSAPMHQTFTGLRPGEHPFSRHVQHGPSALSQTSHIHHVPATQTNNRLPPIADVFANDRLDAPRSYGHSPQMHIPPPVPSPSFPPPQFHQQPPSTGRGREYRSAEEAVQGLSGGREDLLPKVVHYGGVQPPTPPSPMPPHSGHSNHHLHQHHVQAVSGADSSSGPRPDILARTSSMNGRRRGREEYERDNGSSPSSSLHRSDTKRAAFGLTGEDSRSDDWMAGMSGMEKKEEFLRLCERAWDLFHS